MGKKLMGVVGYYTKLFPEIAEQIRKNEEFNKKLKEMGVSAIKSEEFKVDKLGWYETRDGRKIKVLHDFGNNTRDNIRFICIEKNGLDDFRCNYNGECSTYNSGNGEYIKYNSDCNLIKYFGPELPTKPREFEFNGWAAESENFQCAIQFFACMPRQNLPFKGKWHVTMKELLDE